MSQPHRVAEELAEPTPEQQTRTPVAQEAAQAAAVITADAHRRVRATVPARRAVATIRVARHQAAAA